MILGFFVLIIAGEVHVLCKSISDNNTDIISKYAKVARWGSGSSSATTQGRSNNNGQIWAHHRSDHKIVSGQNLKPAKSGVIYQYPVQRKPSQKVDHGKVEKIPAVGEVQERFNPRPYFDYQHVPYKQQNSKMGNNKAAATSAPTFDSFPVFSQPPTSNPTPDLYTSPYSSYNPPPQDPSDSPPSDSIGYPPNASPPDDTPPPPAPNVSNGYSYDPPSGDSDASPSLGPPLAPDDDNDHDHPKDEQLFYPPSENGHHDVILDHPPPGYEEQKPDMMPPMMNGMKGHAHQEVILDHPPPGYVEQKPDMMSPMNNMNNMMSPMNNMNNMMNGMKGQDHPEVILDHPPPGYEEQKPDMMPPMNNMDNMMNGMKGHDMAEHDLSPPPSSPDFDTQFPKYLYGDSHGQDFSSYDFDHHHHVYKEITTTTTTEAPEDERVNKGQYSYYYLGKKLYYVPLYFSVYFIIYVTVLILKSIARHKVQVKHNFHYNRDKGRDADDDSDPHKEARALKLDEIQANVTTAIDSSKKKFEYVAM